MRLGTPEQRWADELDKITSRDELPASRLARIEQKIRQRLVERELVPKVSSRHIDRKRPRGG